jgi:hypothetical protein
VDSEISTYQVVTTSGQTVTVKSASKVYINLSWTRSGTSMVITRNGHGLAIGDMTIVRNTNVASFSSYITAATTNTFTVTCPNSGATAGSQGSYSCGIKYAHNSSTPGQIVSGVASLPSSGESVEILSMRIYFAANTRQTTTYNVTVPVSTVDGATTGFDNFVMPNDRIRMASTGTPSVVSSTLASVATGGNWNTFQLGAIGVVANPVLIMLSW